MNDKEWMIAESEKRGLTPPTENSLDAFQEKVGQSFDETNGNYPLNNIREDVFSLYTWGEIGDLPKYKVNKK